MNTKSLIRSIVVSAAVLAVLGLPSHARSEIAGDPAIRRALSREQFEPGGRYHLFVGSRGRVAERSGGIGLVSVHSGSIGSLRLEHALISGNPGYILRFSGHGHEEHYPFDQHNHSGNARVKEGVLGVYSTAYTLSWGADILHPADAYDGPRGGGYPAPRGARDEYSYTVKGAASRVSVESGTARSTGERFADRFGNARGIFSGGMKEAAAALGRIPERNVAGGTAALGNALDGGLKGVGGAVWEVVGAGDVAAGAATLKAAAGLEAVRALPPAVQVEAVGRLVSVTEAREEAAGRLEMGYEAWAARNPNLAEVAALGGGIWDLVGGRGARDRLDAKKPRDSSKNERHGDGGRAQTAAERRIAELQAQITGVCLRKRSRRLQKQCNGFVKMQPKKEKERGMVGAVDDYYPQFIPFQSVGEFKFGEPVGIYTDILKNFSDDGRECDIQYYRSADDNLVVGFEEDKVASIMCEEKLFYKTKNLIGMAVTSFMRILDCNYVKIESYDIFEDGEISYAYAYR